MRVVIIIAVLISATVALKCYSGLGQNFTWVEECPPTSKQCYRAVKRGGKETYEYTGCDDGTISHCSGWFTKIPNGKCLCHRGAILASETCCCGEDLCNVDDYFDRPPCTGTNLLTLLVDLILLMLVVFD